MKPAKLIAEIGCNHKGDINIATEMIKTAALFCKVDGVKFQKRTPKELLTREEYNAPHPNPTHSYGKTYGEHREYLEFDIKTHIELKKICDDLNLIYSCSVWDLTAAKEILTLKPKIVKIPSACNTNNNLLEYVSKEHEGEIHISLGMTFIKEEEKIIDILLKHNRAKDTVLYACTSGYPVKFSEVNLLEIKRLKQKYGEIIKEVGFSGHHLGIAIDIAAYTLGAIWIERHYTLDRTWKGTDHAASLEPDGLRRLKRDLQATEEALAHKKKEILDVEIAQRKKLKRF
ncbi:MAG: N-acetylneuraminate synthase family protein [Calditrichia bacterium]